MGREPTPTPATFDASPPEQLILEVLRSGQTFTVEEIIEKVPDLSWGQLFFAMDALSRRGDVQLRRRDFSYELQAASYRVGVGGGSDETTSACPG